jgi:hypothetical protein
MQEIGFGGLLAIVFIVLKLTKVITWSWLWVLAPIWIPIGIALLYLVLMVIWAFIGDITKKK